MTDTDILDDVKIDLAIEQALNDALGHSYFAKPKLAAEMLNISDSTFWRGVASRVIETVPHSDGHAVTRPFLGHLMKHGVPKIPSVVPRGAHPRMKRPPNNSAL